jgi:elongation factor P--beta-lysine ligase
MTLKRRDSGSRRVLRSDLARRNEERSMGEGRLGHRFTYNHASGPLQVKISESVLLYMEKYELRNMFHELKNDCTLETSFGSNSQSSLTHETVRKREISSENLLTSDSKIPACCSTDEPGSFWNDIFPSSGQVHQQLLERA